MSRFGSLSLPTGPAMPEDHGQGRAFDTTVLRRHGAAPNLFACRMLERGGVFIDAYRRISTHIDATVEGMMEKWILLATHVCMFWLGAAVGWHLCTQRWWDKILENRDGFADRVAKYKKQRG